MTDGKRRQRGKQTEVAILHSPIVFVKDMHFPFPSYLIILLFIAGPELENKLCLLKPSLLQAHIFVWVLWDRRRFLSHSVLKHLFVHPLKTCAGNCHSLDNLK